MSYSSCEMGTVLTINIGLTHIANWSELHAELSAICPYLEIDGLIIVFVRIKSQKQGHAFEKYNIR